MVVSSVVLVFCSILLVTGDVVVGAATASDVADAGEDQLGWQQAKQSRKSQAVRVLPKWKTNQSRIAGSERKLKKKSKLDPRVQLVESFPKYGSRVMGSISMPQGSPWCNGALLVTGHTQHI